MEVDLKNAKQEFIEYTSKYDIKNEHITNMYINERSKGIN